MDFLLILYFVVASITPGAPPLEMEARRMLVRVSSPAACTAYGAEQARLLAAETHSAHRITHRCYALANPGAMT